LREGDYFSEGKLHDCDGKEIPVVEAEHEHAEPRAVHAKSSEHV